MGSYWVQIKGTGHKYCFGSGLVQHPHIMKKKMREKELLSALTEEGKKAYRDITNAMDGML